MMDAYHKLCCSFFFRVFFYNKLFIFVNIVTRTVLLKIRFILEDLFHSNKISKHAESSFVASLEVEITFMYL